LKNAQVCTFKAHNDMLTSMEFLTIRGTYLLTSALDSYIRIWNLETAELIGSLNVNHPLPVKWEFVNDNLYNCSARIVYTMRIMNALFSKYQSEMKYDEE